MICNASTTQVLFFFAVLLFAASYCSKNSPAAIFRKKVFRYIGSHLNRNSLLAAFNSFFSALKRSTLAFYSFLKKLKF
jgi:hypothetical protein